VPSVVGNTKILDTIGLLMVLLSLKIFVVPGSGSFLDNMAKCFWGWGNCDFVYLLMMTHFLEQNRDGFLDTHAGYFELLAIDVAKYKTRIFRIICFLCYYFIIPILSKMIKLKLVLYTCLIINYLN